MKLKGWGKIDGVKWAPSVALIDTENYDKATLEKVLEKHIDSNWMILDAEFDNDTKPMEDKLIITIKRLASLYPGIILYGEPRYPNQPIGFYDGMWDVLGRINSQGNINAIDARIKRMRDNIEAITKPKRVPPLVAKMKEKYQGQLIVDIPERKLQSIQKWYNIIESNGTLAIDGDKI